MPSGHYRTSDIQLGEIDPNIGAMLMSRAEKWPDHPIVKFRDAVNIYSPVTWGEFFSHMASISAFLVEHGIGKGDRISVFSQNSYYMLVWEMAVISMGAVSVPIFHGYDLKNVDFILNHSEPEAIFIDGESRLKIAEESSYFSQLTTVVTSNGSAYQEIGEILSGGDENKFREKINDVHPDDLSFVQYTSGTTGEPKGVMLTHRNMTSQRKAMSYLWDIPFNSRFLSYLPWHHSFGGLFERFGAIYHGATIHIEDSKGKNLARLMDNWTEVKPTMFFSVPKIYIALVTEAKTDSKIHDAIFHPELKFVFTAAAPLPKDCAEYFRENNIPVVEGWGLTETSPCVTFTSFDADREAGCVGNPIPGCEVLVDEHDEILVRGPNVMKGYYKDKEKTLESLDELGWFRTHDLGSLGDNGLRITCRMDDLFKLSNGEKVSSMVVENALTMTSDWIQHALAIGSGQEYVGALVWLNLRHLESWAEENNRTLKNGWELSGDSEIQKLVAVELMNNMSDVQPKYMRVKSFVIIPGDLTLENGDLTPTFKIVRTRVLEKYSEWCNAIYLPDSFPEKADCVVSLI
ncbi:MAG TPA: AMP-binding protein [bacterium]|jgi:long-subunit acyl-CoA synthetase (AMP-forming)